MLVICVTRGIPSPDYPKRIAVADISRVGRFAEVLNRLRLAPRGAVFNCPISYGPQPEAGLFFNYPTGNVLVVKIDGCPLASNGTRVALGPSPIWRLIHQAWEEGPA